MKKDKIKPLYQVTLEEYEKIDKDTYRFVRSKHIYSTTNLQAAINAGKDAKKEAVKEGKAKGKKVTVYNFAYKVEIFDNDTCSFRELTYQEWEEGLS